MANKNLTYTVDADVKGYQEGMEEAVYSTDKTEAAIQNLIDSTPKLKKSLKEAKDEALRLANAFAQLSDEEKRSKPGLDLAKNLSFAEGKSAELQHTLSETSNRIKKLSEDGQALDAISDGFGTIGNSASAILGIIGMATGKQEDFNKAISAYTTVQSAANAITSLKNAVQKDSNIMIAIERMQLAAATKAEDLKTAATGKATIAQKAFNAVAKANPYVLLATAIVAVGAALTAFIIHSNKAKKAHEEEKAALEQEKEALDAYKNTMTNSLGASIISYKTLQAEWKKCNTELSKTEFIKKHQSEFKKLGVEVKNTADAENTFNNNESEVVAGLIKRAKAAAKAAQAQVYYGQAIAKTIELESLQSRKLQELAEAKDETVTQTVGTSTSGAVMTTTYTITAAQKRAKIEKKYMEEEKKRQAEIEKLNERGDKLINEAVEEGYTDGGGKNENKSGGKQTKEQLTRYEKLKKKADEAYKAIQNLDENSPTFEVDKQKAWKTYDDALKTFKDYSIKIGMEIVEPPEEGSVDWFTNKISELTKKQKKLKIGSEGWKELQDQIDYYNRQQIEINATVNSEKIKAEADKILQDALKDVNPKIDIDTNFLTEDEQKSLTTIQDKISAYEQAKSEYEKIVANPDIDTTTYDIYNEKLRETNELLAEQIEKQAEVASTARSRKKDVKTAEDKAEAYGQYAAMLGSVSNAMNVLGDSEEAEAAKFAVNTAATITNAISTIAAMNAEALAKGASSAFALPFPANLAAWATVLATITSIFASLPSFAGGGIIPGGTSLTDNRLANVAAGEMILNQRQQDNLFKAIDQDKLGSGGSKVEVTGVLRGKDLLLVQKNYNTTASRGQKIRIN